MNPRNVRLRALAVLFALNLTLPALFAAAPAGRTVLKLGTVAPTGSSLHRIIQEMGTTWATIPGGAELRIFAGGIAGGESAMISKMKIGQLDAALITANGLADIDPAVQALQGIPMLFKSLDEIDYVAEQLRPKLDQRLREKGFVALFWVQGSWVRYFSKTPVHTPGDLKQTKLFTWAGDTQTFDIIKSAGFHPVALETNDILPMLRTGMITAVPSLPFVALTSQTFTAAPYMLEIDWAPLVGALVVTERAWNKLTPAAQTEMAKVAYATGIRMTRENRIESDAAVEAMKKRGLKIYRPSAEEENDWRRVAESSYPRIRGTVVPAAFFDEVQRLVAGYRTSHPAKIQATAPKVK